MTTLWFILLSIWFEKSTCIFRSALSNELVLPVLFEFFVTEDFVYSTSTKITSNIRSLDLDFSKTRVNFFLIKTIYNKENAKKIFLKRHHQKYLLEWNEIIQAGPSLEFWKSRGETVKMKHVFLDILLC